MEKFIISREDAYAQSLRFYFTGQPCNAGHIAERYTSGGNCIECLAVNQQKQKVKNNMRRRRFNAMRAKDDTSFVMSIPEAWVTTFQHLQEIAVRCNEDQHERMAAIVESMHKETRTPFLMPKHPMRPTRTVNREDILRVIDWRDGKVQNLAKLEIKESVDSAPVIIKIGPEWYVGEHVMNVIHDRATLARPYNPETDNNVIEAI